jgi:hypothetical protein
MFSKLKEEADAEKEADSAPVEYDEQPLSYEELINQGAFIAFYGETATLKSSCIASTPYMAKQYIPLWRDQAPLAAEMLEKGNFPDMSGQEAMAVVDLDKKWGKFMGSGDWVDRGFQKFVKEGIIKVYQVTQPTSKTRMGDDGKLHTDGLADMEWARNKFVSIIKKICANKAVKVVVIDPFSKFLDLCTRNFLVAMDKIMPTLMKTAIDGGDALRQSHFGVRNQWFMDAIEALRDSGKWVFLSFNMNRNPPQYQKTPEKDDQFNTAVFKVSWTGKTPEAIDQITYCYRIPNAKDSKKDEYHFQFKKGPWKPVQTDFMMPDTEYMMPVYLNTIAQSIMGKKKDESGSKGV